jgi:hypothetical protein
MLGILEYIQCVKVFSFACLLYNNNYKFLYSYEIIIPFTILCSLEATNK